MEGVNPFIKNNKHRMIMFLDELGVSYASFFREMIRLLRSNVRVLTFTSVLTECPRPARSHGAL